MSDDLVKRLRSGYTPAKDGKNMTWEAQSAEAADRIEQLQAERDEALNQLDSARHSVEVLEKRLQEARMPSLSHLGQADHGEGIE